MLNETEYRASAGLPTMAGFIILLLLSGLVAGYSASQSRPIGFIGGLIAVTLCCVCFAGFFVVNPGEAKALQLFG